MRLFLGYLELDHVRLSRASASPVDHRPYGRGLALEDCLNRTIITIGDPTGHAMRPSLPATGITEEHSLHLAMGHHSATNHGTSVDQPVPHRGMWSSATGNLRFRLSFPTTFLTEVWRPLFT
jgi:hypothetical protein